VIFANGVAFGLFAAPNTTSVMNSFPARYRGVASGIRGTFQNTGRVQAENRYSHADRLAATLKTGGANRPSRRASPGAS